MRSSASSSFTISTKKLKRKNEEVLQLSTTLVDLSLNEEESMAKKFDEAGVVTFWLGRSSCHPINFVHRAGMLV